MLGYCFDDKVVVIFCSMLLVRMLLLFALILILGFLVWKFVMSLLRVVLFWLVWLCYMVIVMLSSVAVLFFEFDLFL